MFQVVLIRFVDLFVWVFSGLILARVVVSWIAADPESNWWSRIIFELTEPVLAPIRKVASVGGGLDLSPMVAYFLLRGLQYLVHRLLLGG